MAKRKKRNMEDLRYYRLHDQDRPLNYVIYKTFPVLEDLQYYYEYELKKSESIGLFVMEEQENDKSNPGRLRKIFCLCRM